MITVHLYGSMAKEFGTNYRLDVASVGEAIRLLDANFKGRLIKWIKGRLFHVVVGKDLDTGEQIQALNVIDAPMLALRRPGRDIHIVPKGRGSASKGLLMIVLGTVLVAGAIILSGGSLAAPLAALTSASMGAGTLAGTAASMGFAMILGGISQVLSPTAASNYGSREDANSKPSDMFSGPINTMNQGNCVPVIYGECIVGSQVASASLSTARVPIDS